MLGRLGVTFCGNGNDSQHRLTALRQNKHLRQNQPLALAR
jgi:hypothetical protein